jgi:zinc protease
MLNFEKFETANGLTVIVNEDLSTPLVAMNILYKVGARDESPEKTGFAHLFEHLMFGGSVNIPDYDKPLQRAGAENNAFTNNDFTNYYLTIPAPNLETAFWLESDRMLSLAFTPKSLEVQRQVVIEEFRQRYLNQPFGDVWLLLRPLAYKVHPYQWATIGKDISHIENATLDDVKKFFKRFYAPDNAILTLSGNINAGRAKSLTEKWFGPIPPSGIKKPDIPAEPVQTEPRVLEVERKVSYDVIYKAFHCCSRGDKEFYATDLLTDILSRGKSSRMYQELVKKRKLFTDVGVYMMGDLDKSLIVVEGKLVKGIDMKLAEAAIDEELEKAKSIPAGKEELTKVKNKIESGLIFSEMNIGNKALNLAYFEMLGNAADANRQVEYYGKVNAADMQKIASQVFVPGNCSTLYYLSKN